MVRYTIAAFAVLLAGCATGNGPAERAGNSSTPCSGRYVLACDVSSADRTLDPDKCRCVRTSDVTAIANRATFGQVRGLRTRIR